MKASPWLIRKGLIEFGLFSVPCILIFLFLDWLDPPPRSITRFIVGGIGLLLFIGTFMSLANILCGLGGGGRFGGAESFSYHCPHCRKKLNMWTI